MEKQKPMAEKDKQQRRESAPQAQDKQQNQQPKQQTPGALPGERSDKESIGQPVQLDTERPGAERQRPPMDREKQPD